jgi:hypothetical protein
MGPPASLAALLLLAACGREAPPQQRQEPPTPPVPAKAAAAEPTPDPPADLAGMSPRQRRAYQAGLADCRAGRYQPDPYPEAYRIGCAAAHDR